MANDAPKATVGLICRNEEKTIAETLKHLCMLDFKDYDIIVVDGNSSDKTRFNAVKELKKHNIKFLVLNEKDHHGSGRAFARNLIMQKSKAKYVAFTDADCVVDKDWLRIIYDAISKTGKNVVAAGGRRLVYDDDPWLAKTINNVMVSDIGSGNNAAFKGTKQRYMDSCANYNAIYKRDLILKHPYDPEFRGGDDLELNFRLNTLGYKIIYVEDAIVYHHQNNSLYDFAWQMFHYGDVMTQAVKKHKRLLRIYSIVPSLFVLFNIACLIASFFSIYIFIGYAIIIGLYVLFLVYSAVKLTFKHRSFSMLFAPVVMIVQHLYYGFGFLRGLMSRKHTR